MKQLEALLTDTESKQDIRQMMASQQSERTLFFQQLTAVKNSSNYLDTNRLKRSLFINISAWNARVSKVSEQLPISLRPNHTRIAGKSLSLNPLMMLSG